MTFYSRLKLRGKLVTLLLMFGIIPALVIFSIFQTHQNDYRQDRMRPLLEMARSINDVIDRNLFERYGDVQAFTLNQAVQNQSNWGSLAEDNPLINAMNGYMTNYGIYQLMLVLDRSGNVVAVNTRTPQGKSLDTSTVLGKNFAEETWFKNALEDKFMPGTSGLTGTAVEQPRRIDIVGQLYDSDGLVIPFSAPIKNLAGESVGVWANFADFGLVEQILDTFYQQAKAEGMEELEIALINSQGVMLSDYDPMEGKDLKAKRDWTILGIEKIQDHFPQVQEVLNRKSGTVITTHEGNNHELAAGYAPSIGALGFPGLGWAVVAQVPVKSIFSTLQGIVYTIEIAMLISALAIVGLGYLTGNSFARPLQQITEAMNLLSNNATERTLDLSLIHI